LFAEENNYIFQGGWGHKLMELSGMNFLKNLPITIDYDNKKLRYIGMWDFLRYP